MKIDGSSRFSAEKLGKEFAERLRENRSRDQVVAKPASSPPSTTVTISKEARLLAKAKAAAEAQPDMRGRLVNDIRTKVQAGQYRVDEARLAEKMLES